MHFVYGMTLGNAPRAKCWYGDRFPQRPLPHVQTLITFIVEYVKRVFSEGSVMLQDDCHWKKDPDRRSVFTQFQNTLK